MTMTPMPKNSRPKAKGSKTGANGYLDAKGGEKDRCGRQFDREYGRCVRRHENLRPVCRLTGVGRGHCERNDENNDNGEITRSCASVGSDVVTNLLSDPEDILGL